MQTDSEKFPGFPPEMRRNFWMHPRIMDFYTHLLSGSEAKVLNFVLRRTWGFEKVSDTMSVEQIARGGGRIGTGTGLSPRQVITALHGLEQKGFITIARRSGRSSRYSLVVQEVLKASEETNGAKALVSGANAETASAIDSTSIDTLAIKIYKRYSSLIRPGVNLTQEARKNVIARLGEYHPGYLVAAMRNVAEDDYWGPIAQKNTIAWFFAHQERIETFLALGPYEWPRDFREQAKP